MRDYPTFAELLAMHAILQERYGGAPGLRDPGALEAALFRPQSGYYQDVVEEAAALLESLLVNHPFVDGNKRLAFAACHAFLDINGFTLNADPHWLHERILYWLEQREKRFESIVADLRACLTKR
ncbi:type II toxin-antitoxin system death-on-curing family toxin [Desulfovibrio sp. OttesenSCG-928-G11]|nr:type II toxin-antitoxin system death-on-curing family toxin [Desulfovibrio sp. OttesenSCG-928-G11]